LRQQTTRCRVSLQMHEQQGHPILDGDSP